MVLIPNDRCAYKRRDTQEELCVAEAEMRVIRNFRGRRQAQKLRERKAQEAVSPEPSQGAGPMATLISNFWPSRIVTEYIAVVVSPPTSRSRVGAAVGG